MSKCNLLPRVWPYIDPPIHLGETLV